MNLKKYLALLVEIPRYMPEGCGFYSGWDQWLNPSGRTMALGSTHPLTDMSTRGISWGIKAAGAYGWQLCHLRVPTVWKFWKPLPPQPWGPVQGSIGIALLYLLREIFSNIYKPKFSKIQWKVTAPINSVLHRFGDCKEKTQLSKLVPRGEFQTPQLHFIHPARYTIYVERFLFVRVFKAPQYTAVSPLKDND
jgi:hypothetical protein